MFTLEHICPGDSVKWEFEGKEYAGVVTQILARTLLCAKTPDGKEWVMRAEELNDHQHKTQEVHL